MSAYCLDCGERTQRTAGGTLVIRHAADCPDRFPMSHARVDVTRRDEAGRRIAAPLRCACGWQSTSTNGWNGLIEFYDHAGVLRTPKPPVDAVERFLEETP